MVWDACARFMAQLYWHKSRPVMLGPKIEALPDDHPSKAQGLLQLSRLFDSAGNLVERKRLVNHTLRLWRERGDDLEVVRTLRNLSDADRILGLHDEGIQQAREASNIFERLGDPVEQAVCLVSLAWLLLDNRHLGEAEEMATRTIDLLPEGGKQGRVYQCHRVLGQIYRYKGEMEKAVHHFEKVLGIGSALNSAEDLFSVHLNLAELFIDQGRFDDAQTHVEHTKTLASNDIYLLACVSFLQARLWYMQDMFGEARIEALIAFDTFTELGSVEYVESVRLLLQQIDARWP